MQKMKTHSSSKKRFKVTKSGKIKRRKAYKSHLLNGKSRKRKRGLRQATLVSSAMEKTIKTSLIPYK
jgi:large subunit ribosomal protein L35